MHKNQAGRSVPTINHDAVGGLKLRDGAESVIVDLRHIPRRGTTGSLCKDCFKTCLQQISYADDIYIWIRIMERHHPT